MESTMDCLVIDAALEWLVERTPNDPGEKKLAAALMRAYPEERHTRETCQCGESADCDECMSDAQWNALIEMWEQETTPIAEAV